MNKKLTAFLALLIILAFMGYIIYDASNIKIKKSEQAASQETSYYDRWEVVRKIDLTGGKTSSVAVSDDGTVFLAGNSFIRSLNTDLSEKWNLKTDSKITSLAVSGDTIFASTAGTILLASTGGKLIAEWGPYEDNSLITSVTAGKDVIAFADAGSKKVFLLKKNGELKTMIGQSDEKFLIPSPYFDVALSGSTLFIANTGNHRIEKWTTDGKKIAEFGEPGTAPGKFCGCCNPAHFALIPQGIVTAEKGLNRIKIMGPEGEFIEFVSSNNNFVPSVPLDVASADGKTIYAINSADSTLYLFKRKL